MARFNPHHDNSKLYPAMREFAAECLLRDGSLLQPGLTLWTSENLQELDRSFVQSPDAGDGTYYVKLGQQVGAGSPDSRKLMAELHWLLFVFPSDMNASTKVERIKEMWAWSGDELPDDVAFLNHNILEGLGHTGPAYKNHRWRELSFLIGALQLWKKLLPEQREENLAQSNRFTAFLDAAPEVDGRQLRHILPHLLFPDEFERISSPRHKREILEGFGVATRREANKMDTASLDAAIFDLRKKLEAEHGRGIDFYQPTIESSWRDRGAGTVGALQPPQEVPEPTHSEVDTTAKEASAMAQNLIVYGPPGTGKTYSTTAEAVRLCGEQVPAERDALMDVYQRLLAAGRIEFVTFHQSMAYEDFVEGRQPMTGSDDGESTASAGFRLETVPGTFRRIAKRAETSRGRASTADSVRIAGRQVFKMSIGEANKPEDAHLFEDAIKGGYAVLGFEDIDWSDEKYASREAIFEACKANSAQGGEIDGRSGAVQMPFRFRNWIRTGDVVIVSNGNSKFRAIGLFTGGYEFAPRPEGDYAHRRAVRWLWVDREGVPVDEIYSRRFMQQSIYLLHDSELNVPALERYMNSQHVEGAADPEPFVLIIDEINRANISKVFGELITLLEPDKRLGQPNQIKVRLPYSGDEFGVPSNLHILGTMNTADRSIALLDTALRRRFAFRELMPDPAVLKDAAERTKINLPMLLTTINDRIEYLYDREHQIGHAYFTGCATPADVDEVMRHKVIPLLAEYFFEDWAKIAAVLGDLEAHDHDISGGFLNRSALKAPPGLDNGEALPRFRWSVRSVDQRFNYTRLLAP